uniref:Uncharacterized protein n=1 Tax=Acrobeloides nanus TaxID=290746 RepID=A0A914EK92_9BILA
MPFTWHLIAIGGEIVPHNNNTLVLGYYFVEDINVPGQVPGSDSLNPRYKLIFLAIAGFTGFIMNLYTVIILIKRRKEILSSNNITNTKDSEIKLFLFAVFLFIMHLGVMALRWSLIII